MRSLRLTILACLLATACSGNAVKDTVEESDTDTDTDADTDTDTDTDADTDTDTDLCDTADTAIAFYGRRGDATVDVNNGTWAGTETLYFETRDTGGNPVLPLCNFTWDTTGTPFTGAACEDSQSTPCTFAFSVSGTNGTETAGDCVAYLGAMPASSFGPRGYGFHPSYDGGYPAFMYFHNGSWYAPDYVSADFPQGSGTFDYDWIRSAYYIPEPPCPP